MKNCKFLVWFRPSTREWVFEIVYSSDEIHGNYRYPAKTILGTFFVFCGILVDFLKILPKCKFYEKVNFLSVNLNFFVWSAIYVSL